MATEGTTTASERAFDDVRAFAVSSKVIVVSPRNEPSDHVAEPASEDAIARDAPPDTQQPRNVNRSESHSSDSEERDAEASGSSAAGESEDERDEDEEDAVDALTRGFQAQVGIFRSTYLQTVEGDVIVTGPGFSSLGFYKAMNGNVYSTARDPPQACRNCQGNHWRKDCPRGRRY